MSKGSHVMSCDIISHDRKEKKRGKGEKWNKCENAE